MKTRGATAVALIAAFALTSCGGESPYCAAVGEQTEVLNSFGKTRSNAAYTTYVKVFSDVAEVAPDAVKKDWTALAEVTQGVLDAQDEVGLPLEKMTDAPTVEKLSKADRATLNAAYKAFNGTTTQRTAVVKNVLQECDITLT